MALRSSDIVEERGNRFVAHVATIKSPNDIPVTLNAIKYSFHAIATATHNVWAARIQGTEAVAEYSDDDGEHGGAREIAKELRNQNLANHMVVVTRWASGVQLGRKRFDIIAQRTKAVLRKYRASTQTGTKLSTAATTTTPTASISTTSGQPGSVPATSVSTQVHPAQAPVMGPPKGGSGAMCYVPKSLACYVLCKFLFTLLCEIQKGCYAEVQPVLCAM